MTDEQKQETTQKQQPEAPSNEPPRLSYSLNLKPEPVEDPKVVLITGASSGIGRATALLLAVLGHKVAAVARRMERLEALEVEAEDLFGEILALEGDVRSPEDMRRVASETLAYYNRLDVLVANAGLGHRGRVEDSEWEDIETILQTNIDGVLHSIRACIPPMRAGGSGQIITISSVVGPVPAPGAAIYSMSKAAIDSLAQALRTELRKDNIKVTNMIVGQTHTEFSEKRRGISGRVASKWPTMEPEKVASSIAQAIERQPRQMTLRLLDKLFIWVGKTFPRIMDRILAKVYLED